MDARQTVLALIEERGHGKSACPSEAARRLPNDGDWRGEMKAVHKAIDTLHAEGRIVLHWKGAELRKRNGPYRIALALPDQPL